MHNHSSFFMHLRWHVSSTIATTCRNPVKQCLIVQNPASVPISTVSKGNFLHQPTTNYSKCFDTQFHPAGGKKTWPCKQQRVQKLWGKFKDLSPPPPKKWSCFQIILQPNVSTKNRLFLRDKWLSFCLSYLQRSRRSELVAVETNRKTKTGSIRDLDSILDDPIWL